MYIIHIHCMYTYIHHRSMCIYNHIHRYRCTYLHTFHVHVFRRVTQEENHHLQGSQDQLSTGQAGSYMELGIYASARWGAKIWALSENSVAMNTWVRHHFPYQDNHLGTWRLYPILRQRKIFSHASCFRVIILYTRSPFLSHGLASCDLTNSTRYHNNLCPLPK